MLIDRELIEASSPGSLSEANLAIDIQNVALSDALRYVTELSGTQWRVDPDSIVIVPGLYGTMPPVTRRYYVPPSLYEKIGHMDVDPNREWLGAMERLQSVGIPFAEGTAASYNPSRSELQVTIGGNEHELVAALVEAHMMDRAGVEKQVEVRIRRLEAREPRF